MPRTVFLRAAALLGLFVMASCSSDTATTPATLGLTGSVRVMLTDAPSDLIAEALVTIERIYLVAPEEGGDPVTLFDAADDPEAEPKTYNLLDLRDGIEAFLTESPVPAGDYAQLRLVVSDPQVTLVEGYEFRDGTTTKSLKVPSGHTSGIKVQLAEPLTVDEGMVTIVVVDFDVNENFVIQGNAETPAGIHGVLFKPVLKEKHRSQMHDDDDDDGDNEDDDLDDEDEDEDEDEESEDEGENEGEN